MRDCNKDRKRKRRSSAYQNGPTLEVPKQFWKSSQLHVDSLMCCQLWWTVSDELVSVIGHQIITLTIDICDCVQHGGRSHRVVRVCQQ